jgi:hypothetical protein
MSDISLFSSPGDTSILLGILLLMLLAGGLLLSLSIAWLRTMGGTGRIVDDRFFGYFIGGVTAMVATLLFLGSVEASGKGAYASFADDWAGVWIGGMIAIWLATAYRWNVRRRGTTEARAGQETV